MFDVIKEYWLPGIFATLILGAMGSGLWDLMFKPLFHKAGKLLFILFTFGQKRASDKIYRSAARGFRELPSLMLFMLALGFASIAAIRAPLDIFLSLDKLSIVEEHCKGKLDTNDYRACKHEFLREEINKKQPYFIFICSLLLLTSVYLIIITNRTNLVLTNFNQSLLACKPYMEEKDIQLLESRFSLMNSRDSYLEIMKILNEIANKNSFTLPSSYL